MLQRTGEGLEQRDTDTARAGYGGLGLPSRQLRRMGGDQQPHAPSATEIAELEARLENEPSLGAYHHLGRLPPDRVGNFHRWAADVRASKVQSLCRVGCGNREAILFFAPPSRYFLTTGDGLYIRLPDRMRDVLQLLSSRSPSEFMFVAARDLKFD